MLKTLSDYEHSFKKNDCGFIGVASPKIWEGAKKLWGGKCLILSE